jgi:hypothetical protein
MPCNPRWHNAFSYLDPNAPLGNMAPRPALHEGLKAKLTMTLAMPGESNRRLVLRAFKTSALLTTTSGVKPVFLVSLTQESLRKTLHTYAVPVLIAANDAQVAQVDSDFLSGANTTSSIAKRPNSTDDLLLITGP